MADVLVWHWVQQHRWLSVLVLAIVILVSAGGTAWALVFRTVSSPVGLREALRIYRKEQTNKVLASLRAHLPAPGVYTYRTKGSEGLNLVGLARSFPDSTLMVVTDNKCATVSWMPITQHTEVTAVCPSSGGALTVPQLMTRESIAGTTTTSTVDCPSTAYLLPAAARSGQRWHASCSLVDPNEAVTFTGEVLGTSTVAVAGHQVTVEHTRFTLTYAAGAERGTNPTDFWVVPDTGLIVREKEAVDVSQGGVHYNEDMDAVLTGLSPAR
jgi:hypothetical protein